MLKVCFIKSATKFKSVENVLQDISDIELSCFNMTYDEFSKVDFYKFDVVVFGSSRDYMKDIEMCILNLDLLYDGVVMVIDEEFSFSNKLIFKELGCEFYFYLPLNLYDFSRYFLWFINQILRGNKIEYKDLSLNLDERTFQRGSNILKLKNMEFRLLKYLLKNRGKVISKERILEEVWDMNSLISSKTVEVHMCRLRKKIDFEFDNKLLHTIPNTGYMLR